MKIILTKVFMLLTVCNLFGQKITILTNHLGYNPYSPKKAIVQGYQDDEVTTYSLKSNNDDSIVFTGTAQKAGPVDQWKNWIFWTIDFTDLNTEGKYYIECETSDGLVKSFPFLIQKDVVERHTISDVIFYFRGQRCIGLFEYADRQMKFENDGKEEILDVSGGWHDASGDYSKVLSHLSFSTFFNCQQTSLVNYALGKAMEQLQARKNENFDQINRRIVDEMLYGADFLVRMKRPDGSFFRSVAGRGPGKKPENRAIAPAGLQYSIKKKKPTEEDYTNNNLEEMGTPIYETGYRAGAGMSIASLAMTYQLNHSGDYKSEQYLEAAESAFNYLEENNVKLLNDGKENIVDDYCALAAATELYKVTKNEKYLQAADKRADNICNRLCEWNGYENYLRADDKDRPFFHASDEGLPIVTLVYYLEICEKDKKEKVRDTIRKYLEFELELVDEVTNPFNYARQLVQHKDGSRNTCFFFPHDTETAPWWQGENARLGSIASAARLAIPLFSDDAKFSAQLEDYASSQVNWILGLNPFDSSMLHGTGRNNPEYMWFNTYQYTNAPGGIVNGITSGLENEHDIDYNLLYSETGKDFDWRWGEQWLPHAAWYLVAVAARPAK